MRTSLTELLDVDLSFSEIQQQLEDETEGFTVNEGEVWFDRQFEAGVAEGILKLHYGDVENLGIDTADNGEKSLYKIVYSDLIVDDYNFPDETVEESLNEEVSYSKNLKDKYKISQGDLKKYKTEPPFVNDWDGFWKAVFEIDEQFIATFISYFLSLCCINGIDCQLKAIGDYHDRLSFPRTANSLSRILYIPDGIEKLGDYAFAGSSNLKTVYLSPSVINLGECVFRYCYDLENLILSSEWKPLIEERIKDNSEFAGIEASQLKTMNIKYHNYLGSLPSIKPNEIEFVKDFVKRHDLNKFIKVNFINEDFGESLNEDIADLRQKYKRNPNIKIPDKDVWSENAVKAAVDSDGVVVKDDSYESAGSIIIPEGAEAIGPQSFYNCQKLTSITIPNSVIYIYDYAFYCCHNLTSITIPDSVREIGDSAFSYCKSLTSVDIPNGVTSIGEYAFYGCLGLESVTIPDSVTQIGSKSFYLCGNLNSVSIPERFKASLNKIFGKSYKAIKINLTESLDEDHEDVNEDDSASLANHDGPLAKQFFSGKIKESVEVLDESAKTDFISKFGQDTFNNFEKAKQRLVNNGYSTDYGQYLKKDKQEVDDLILSLYNKDSDAQKRRALQGKDKDIRGEFNYLGEAGGFKVYQPLDYISSMDLGVNTGWCTTGRYGHAGHPEFTPSEKDAERHFNTYTKRGVKFYYFLNPQTMYGEYALALYPKTLRVNRAYGGKFIGKTNFELYTAKDSLNYSKANQLADILSNFGVTVVLESSELKKNVTAVVKKGVVVKSTEYKSAKSIIIPDGAIRIGDLAFNECENLISITIPDSVTEIGDYAFNECGKLTSINIPNRVTEIGDDAFSFCKSLKSITIPDGVTSIGEYAFYGCEKLTSITIPDNVTSIGGRAFYWCRNLTSITIPDSVTEIGDYAFFYCKKLTSITIPNSVTSIGWSAFSGCEALTSVTIPKRFENDLKSIFGRVGEKTKINLTESLNEDHGDELKYKYQINAQEINQIYQSLTPEERRFVTADDKPSNKFTNAAELQNYAANISTIYDKNKPIASVIAWKENDEDVAINVMTRNDPHYRHRGYANQAVKKAIEWLKNSGFKRAYWDVRNDNVQSIKLAEKNGFKYIGDNEKDPVWQMYVREFTESLNEEVDHERWISIRLYRYKEYQLGGIIQSLMRDNPIIVKVFSGDLTSAENPISECIDRIARVWRVVPKMAFSVRAYILDKEKTIDYLKIELLNKDNATLDKVEDQLYKFAKKNSLAVDSTLTDDTTLPDNKPVSTQVNLRNKYKLKKESLTEDSRNNNSMEVKVSCMRSPDGAHTYHQFYFYFPSKIKKVLDYIKSLDDFAQGNPLTIHVKIDVFSPDDYLLEQSTFSNSDEEWKSLDYPKMRILGLAKKYGVQIEDDTIEPEPEPVIPETKPEPVYGRTYGKSDLRKKYGKTNNKINEDIDPHAYLENPENYSPGDSIDIVNSDGYSSYGESPVIGTFVCKQTPDGKNYPVITLKHSNRYTKDQLQNIVSAVLHHGYDCLPDFGNLNYKSWNKLLDYFDLSDDLPTPGGYAYKCFYSDPKLQGSWNGWTQDLFDALSSCDWGLSDEMGYGYDKAVIYAVGPKEEEKEIVAEFSNGQWNIYKKPSLKVDPVPAGPTYGRTYGQSDLRKKYGKTNEAISDLRAKYKLDPKTKANLSLSTPVSSIEDLFDSSGGRKVLKEKYIGLLEETRKEYMLSKGVMNFAYNKDVPKVNEYIINNFSTFKKAWVKISEESNFKRLEKCIKTIEARHPENYYEGDAIPAGEYLFVFLNFLEDHFRKLIWG